MSNNNSFWPENAGNSSLYIDEQTQKRIHEHLNNTNDVITEQDIANIGIGVVGDDEIRRLSEIQGNNEESGKNTMEEEIIKDNENPEIETPWNILDE